MKRIKLPEVIIPKKNFYDILRERRTIREFDEKREIEEHKLSFLLFAIYGVTEKTYYLKTAPSAGARYPLEIFLSNKNGVYHYIPEEHSLEIVMEKDIRKELVKAALYQDFIEEAPCVFIIMADFKRTTSRYGERGIRYVYIDAGHAAQNLLLACCALDLGACPVGAFYDEEVKKIMKTQLEPIYIIPVGYKKHFI